MIFNPAGFSTESVLFDPAIPKKSPQGLTSRHKGSNLCRYFRLLPDRENGDVMFNSSVLDVAIGLIFVYLLLGLMCTTVNEWLAPRFQNRAATLKEGNR